MVEVASLAPSGQVIFISRAVPASPLFDEAFGAVANGALIATPSGPVAVEDLAPGDMVTTDSGPMPVLWLGSMRHAPGPNEPSGARLIRLTADSLGDRRPAEDLKLGEHARVKVTSPRLTALVGDTKALAPVRALEDGCEMFEIVPPNGTQVYQLGFASHRLYSANGVEVESLHPGEAIGRMTNPMLLSMLLEFFPHIHRAADFGPLVLPRLTRHEVETVLRIA